MSFDTDDLADNKIAIGCNVIIWDSLLTGLLSGYLLYEEVTIIDIHPVFCILGGLLGAALFFVLTLIKYVNIFVLLFSCLLYENLVSSFLIESLQDEEGFDNIWKWTIHIVLFLVIVAWHIGSYAVFDMPRDNFRDSFSHNYREEKTPYVTTKTITKTEDWNSLNKHYQTLMDRATELLNEFNNTSSSADAVSNLGNGDDSLKACLVTITNKFQHHCKEILRLNHKIKTQKNDYSQSQYIIDEIEEHYTDMLHLHQQLMKDTQQSLANHREYQAATQNNTAGCDESLFQGCEDKESLTKRYRSLMKIYHPDNSNGDLSMTQKIQYTYEKLLNRF